MYNSERFGIMASLVLIRGSEQDSGCRGWCIECHRPKEGIAASGKWQDHGDRHSGPWSSFSTSTGWSSYVWWWRIGAKSRYAARLLAFWNLDVSGSEPGAGFSFMRLIGHSIWALSQKWSGRLPRVYSSWLSGRQRLELLDCIKKKAVIWAAGMHQKDRVVRHWKASRFQSLSMQCMPPVCLLPPPGVKLDLAAAFWSRLWSMALT